MVRFHRNLNINEKPDKVVIIIFVVITLIFISSLVFRI